MTIKSDRVELEKMINQSPETIGKEALDNPELAMEPSFDVDFEELQRKCHKKAKKMIQNATGFMLSDQLIKENSYLKNKMSIDTLSLTGMLYQLSLNETMQKALVEEVRSGAMSARMFEVFGGLSKTIGELNKQLLQTVEAIKITYRDLKEDIREQNQELAQLTDGNFTKNSKGVLALGTKELIKHTKTIKIEKEKELSKTIVEDAEIIE